MDHTPLDRTPATSPQETGSPRNGILTRTVAAIVGFRDLLTLYGLLVLLVCLALRVTWCGVHTYSFFTRPTLKGSLG